MTSRTRWSDDCGTRDSDSRGPMLYRDAGPIRRLVRRLAATAPMSWLYSHTLHHLDRFVYRVTRGRGMFTSALAGLPIVLLTTQGAKSGREVTVPLVGLPLEDGAIAVIASNWGSPQHPGWYHNLRAHPAATVTVDGRRVAVQAREAEGVERGRLWQLGMTVYPGWSGYERRASPRQIPVMLLEPTEVDPRQVQEH